MLPIAIQPYNDIANAIVHPYLNSIIADRYVMFNKRVGVFYHNIKHDA